MVCGIMVFFFFFKQKTAYEMRISDWSSDVCSSDLRINGEGHRVTDNILRANRYQQYMLETNANAIHAYDNLFEQGGPGLGAPYGGNAPNTNCVIRLEVGRASCRERV